MLSKSRWRTNVRVTVRDLRGRVTDVQEFHNLITTVGLDMVRDYLSGDVSDGEIKQLAVGDNATTPALGDTALGNETFRMARTSFTRPATGQVNTVHLIAAADAVGTIEELGWFAGAAATGTGGSGIMVARVLYSRVKTNLETIQIERLDTFTEA